MKTYKDLPELVVRRTLLFALDGARYRYKVWMRKLHLLAICRYWRGIAKRELYRTAFIEIEDTGLDQYELEHHFGYSACVTTNIILIEENQMNSMIKRLSIHSSLPENDAGLVYPEGTLLNMLIALYADMSHCPELPAIRDGLNVDRFDDSNSEIMDRCYRALAGIGADIVSRLPSICDLQIISPSIDIFSQHIFAGLASGYNAQLARLYCKTPAYFPCALSVPNALTCDLIFHNNLDIELPTINPRYIRSLYMGFLGVEFDWNMFHYDKSTDVVSFDNIVKFGIYCDMKYGSFVDEMEVASTNELKLEFPKLEILKIAHVPLTFEDMQSLIQPTLKEIMYSGSLDGAFNLCSQPIGHLDELELRWDEYFYRYERDAFVSKANRVLSKTSRIGRVKLSIASTTLLFSMAGAIWPYVTQLDLNIRLVFDELLPALLEMTKLVKFSLNIKMWDDSILDDAEYTLSDIRQEYTEQSQSKLETVRIVCGDDAICHRSRRSRPFGDAINNLTWLFPNVTIVYGT